MAGPPQTPARSVTTTSAYVPVLEIRFAATASTAVNGCPRMARRPVRSRRCRARNSPNAASRIPNA
jgi:hypothetical protein